MHFFLHINTIIIKNIYLLDVYSMPALEIYDDAQQLPVDPPAQDDDPTIFLHALSVVTTTQTLRVNGFFKNIPLIILIDSSSTHNFLDP